VSVVFLLLVGRRRFFLRIFLLQVFAILRFFDLRVGCFRGFFGLFVRVLWLLASDL